MNAAAFPTELLGRLVDGFNHPAALAVLLVAFACSLTTFVIVVVASELARASATVRRLERSPASSLHAGVPLGSLARSVSHRRFLRAWRYQRSHTASFARASQSRTA